jgi:hypothetical protein
MSTFQRAMVAVCILVLLFVLVCPYTTSPTPLGKVKLVLFFLTLLFFAAVLQLFAAPRPVFFAEYRLSGRLLLDVTCARLC